MTTDCGDAVARLRKLLVGSGGDAEELEAKRVAVAPHAGPAGAAPEALTREVERFLDLQRIPVEVRRLDVERAKSIREAAGGEDRRIDGRGQRSYPLDRLLDLFRQLLERTARGGRIRIEQLLCELERDRCRSEILLDAVVQRGLDPPALPIEVGDHDESVGRGPVVGQHDRDTGVGTLLRRERTA